MFSIFTDEHSASREVMVEIILSPKVQQHKKGNKTFKLSM